MQTEENSPSLKRVFNAVLLIRVIGTIAYISIFIILVFVGGISLTAGVAAISVIAFLEFYNIFRRTGYRPVLWVGALAAPAAVLSAHFGYPVFAQVVTAILLLAFLGFGMFALFQPPSKTPEKADLFVDSSSTLFGALYSGGLLAHIILLRSLPDGADLLLLVVFGTAACDSFAYLVGKSTGRNPFFKHVSPNKTREGALGGLAACTLAVILLVRILEVGVSFGASLVLGLLIGTGVIVGDLIESWFKRRAGLKDSGSWIPQQGGLLDVIDGFMVAVVLTYYFIQGVSLL